MGAGHSHVKPGQGNERALWIALLLTSTFLVAEVVGGILTGSLALISDAAHMFTDTAALAISLVAIRIGKRPADTRRTFGYYRFEILAAAVNAILLFFVAIYILFEAYQRLKNPPEIESMGMLVVATQEQRGGGQGGALGGHWEAHGRNINLIRKPTGQSEP